MAPFFYWFWINFPVRTVRNFGNVLQTLIQYQKQSYKDTKTPLMCYITKAGVCSSYKLFAVSLYQCIYHLCHVSLCVVKSNSWLSTPLVMISNQPFSVIPMKLISYSLNKIHIHAIGVGNLQSCASSWWTCCWSLSCAGSFTSSWVLLFKTSCMASFP